MNEELKKIMAENETIMMKLWQDVAVDVVFKQEKKNRL